MIFRHQGDAGGGDSGVISPAPAAGAEPNPINPAPSPNEGGNPADGGSNQPILPATLDDALKEIETSRKSVADLTSKLTETDSKYKEITRKIGVQGEQVSALRKIQDALKANPKQFISEIAKEYGVEVRMSEDDSKLSLKEAFDADDSEQLERIITAREEAAVQRVKAEIAPHIERMYEQNLRTKYPDYDGLTETRQTLQARLLSKDMTYTELVHLAAQAVHLPEALEAAKVSGRDEYQKQLRSKEGSSHPAGGEHQPAAEGKDDRQSLQSVLAALKRNK